MIQQKLVILKENNVIDEQTYLFMQETLTLLKDKEIIKEESESDTFITHLAMATSRQIKEEEPIDFVDDTIKNEIEKAAEFQQAVEIWEQITDLSPITFPENEKDYFYLHLVTMLQNNN